MKNGIIIGMSGEYTEGGLCMMAPIENGKNRFEKSFTNWTNPRWANKDKPWIFEFEEDIYDGSCFSFGGVSTRYSTSKDWMNISFENPIHQFTVVFQISMENISQLLQTVDVKDAKLVGDVKIKFSRGKVWLVKYEEGED